MNVDRRLRFILNILSRFISYPVVNTKAVFIQIRTNHTITFKHSTLINLQLNSNSPPVRLLGIHITEYWIEIIFY